MSTPRALWTCTTAIAKSLPVLPHLPAIASGLNAPTGTGIDLRLRFPAMGSTSPQSFDTHSARGRKLTRLDTIRVG